MEKELVEWNLEGTKLIFLCESYKLQDFCKYKRVFFKKIEIIIVINVEKWGKLQSRFLRENEQDFYEKMVGT